MIKLPNPKKEGDFSLEKIIDQRRTRREFVKKPIDLEELSQLLWAGQGITDPGKTKRAAPSAGATYPYEILVSVKNIDGLDSDTYKYIREDNKLKPLNMEVSDELEESAFNQGFFENSAANIILAADYEKTTSKYEEKGVRYVHIEAGHIGQNICLQAESLGLGTVLVGSFDDEKVKGILRLKERDIIYILSIGNLK